MGEGNIVRLKYLFFQNLVKLSLSLKGGHDAAPL